MFSILDREFSGKVQFEVYGFPDTSRIDDFD